MSRRPGGYANSANSFRVRFPGSVPTFRRSDMTDLVVQGSGATAEVAAHLAELCGAAQPQPRGSGVWRLHDSARTDVLAAAAGAASCDVALVPADRRLADFRLVVMDMDSTLITIECIDEIADMVGVKPQVAAITASAMRGEIPFAESLRRRVGLIEGLDESALQRVYDERLKLSPGAEPMLATMRASGLKSLLVSGGFTFFTSRLQRRLGLDFTLANTLETSDGKLTGRVLGDIVDATAKAEKVKSVCAELGIETSRTIVIGDGANDLEMMAVAGVSVAYRAKPVVQAKATHALNFSGLDAVLNLFR
jgi:phosphoserine phosphatase